MKVSATQFSKLECDLSSAELDADGVGLLVHLLASVAFALESPLKEAEETGVPVSEDEEDEERDGEEVFGGDGVVDGPCEVAADGELDPGDDAEALAVDGGWIADGTWDSLRQRHR